MIFIIDTDLQGEALREASSKELEEPSGIALALRDWPQAFRVIRRLPTRAEAPSHSCGRWQASNNPKGKGEFADAESCRSAVWRRDRQQSVTLLT